MPGVGVAMLIAKHPKGKDCDNAVEDVSPDMNSEFVDKDSALHGDSDIPIGRLTGDRFSNMNDCRPFFLLEGILSN